MSKSHLEKLGITHSAIHHI